MSSTGDYPAGAEHDPRAPYNKVENAYIDCEVCVSQTLSKTTTVKTNDYESNPEWDNDFVYSTTDFSETNFNSLYAEQHYTPYELIELFKEFLEDKVKNSDFTDPKIPMMKALIEECKDWTEDETEVIFNN